MRTTLPLQAVSADPKIGENMQGMELDPSAGRGTIGAPRWAHKAPGIPTRGSVTNTGMSPELVSMKSARTWVGPLQGTSSHPALASAESLGKCWSDKLLTVMQTGVFGRTTILPPTAVITTST